LLSISEQKFNLEAGLVIPVERDGVKVLIGAEQEGDPLGPPVNDDNDPHRPAQSGEVDDGGFEKVIRVGGDHAGKDGRVPLGPIDLTGVATGGSAPGVGAGVKVTRIGVAPEFTDQVEL